jgi:hypothetical protein
MRFGKAALNHCAEFTELKILLREKDNNNEWVLG